MEEETKTLNDAILFSNSEQEEQLPEQTQHLTSHEEQEKFIEEKLQDIRAIMLKLEEKFDNKIAVDTHKNQLFDNMHHELVKFQNGMMDKILETMVLDVIQLIDQIKKNVCIYEEKEPTEENYNRLLKLIKALSQDMLDVLYRQSVEPYNVESNVVDTRRQKIIQMIKTNIPTQNNLVAARVADGYEKDGKVLRPEHIKIYKYQEPTIVSEEKN